MIRQLLPVDGVPWPLWASALAATFTFGAALGRVAFGRAACLWAHRGAILKAGAGRLRFPPVDRHLTDDNRVGEAGGNSWLGV